MENANSNNYLEELEKAEYTKSKIIPTNVLKWQPRKQKIVSNGETIGGDHLI